MVLGALGKKKPEIARALGVTVPTLNKHYFSDASRFRIRLGEARERVEAKLAAKLLAGVEEGNVAAIKELDRWLERADRNTRLAEEFMREAAPKEEKLGKKEAARRAATTAHENTSWQDLIN